MQPNLQITSAAISDRGLSEKRPQNEDSYLELRESGLFAVADGVGGAQAGDVASQMAMEILAEAFLNLQEDGDVRARMELAIEKANAAIFQMSNDLPQLSSMATTVVALHINGDIATIGHVGDSRLYKLTPQGELLQETLDHSVVEEEVRAGRMTPEQAAVHPSRNVISRALGAEPFIEIDMKTIAIEPGTMFLACSDGVTRHLDDYELRNLLVTTPDAMEVCETIKEICYERGAEDNLTAVVVRAEAEYSEEFARDEEEETIMTARPLAEVNFEEESEGADEFGEETVQVESDAEPAEQAEAGAASSGISIAPQQNQGFLSILSDGKDDDEPSSVSVLTEESGGKGRSILGFVGRLFLMLLVLVIGAAAGGGAVYYYLGMNQPQTVAAPVQPPKIELPSFEQTKAKVLDDPAAVIATLSASPQTAEDHYFLGLAYMLNGRYDEAAIALNNAVDKLPEYDETQRENLRKEISMAKSVVDNPEARNAFEALSKPAGETEAAPAQP